jgi:hypothetical protein
VAERLATPKFLRRPPAQPDPGGSQVLRGTVVLQTAVPVILDRRTVGSNQSAARRAEYGSRDVVPEPSQGTERIHRPVTLTLRGGEGAAGRRGPALAPE